MAKCEKVTEPKYQLELTHDEAETLYRLLGNHIVGDTDGPRVCFTNIFRALDGFNFNELPLGAIGSKTVHLNCTNK